MTRPVTVLLLLGRIDCVDGVAAYLETVITGMREKGHRIVLVSGTVTVTDGSQLRRDAIAGAVEAWVELENVRPARPQWRNLRKMRHAVNHYNVDVIGIQGFSMLPVGWLLGLLTRRPVVANYHPSVHGNDVSQMDGTQLPRQRLLYRAVARLFRPRRFVASSHQIGVFFRDDCRIPQKLISEQVLGVESDFYRPPSTEERADARRRFSIADNTLVAVLPGRMDFSKGHDVAADAVRLLRASRPELNIVCLFPGGGNQRAQIEANVHQNDADRASFRFLGFVDREVLRQTYWAADLVLLPSRMEGFGLVVAEAMCCGAIAIRTPSGGWQDQIIEGKTGYVVPFNDPPALAAAIEKVADAPNRAHMRAETMAFASTKFAKARMIEGISAIYAEAAA
jgi:glycosyltransferase involved in cell wall biosynthesis